MLQQIALTEGLTLKLLFSVKAVTDRPGDYMQTNNIKNRCATNFASKGINKNDIKNLFLKLSVKNFKLVI